MKKLLLILLLSSVSFAQNSKRTFTSYQYKNNVLEVTTNDGKYLIKAYSDKIFETSFIPKGETFNPNSHAVLLSNSQKLSVKNNTNTIEATSNSGKIVIQKNPFQISYFNGNKLLFSEKLGYQKVKHIPLENVKGNIVYDSTEVLDFTISADEKLFGGGARALGMNRRGNRLALYNRAHYGYETHSELMNFCIPVIISSNLYAIHFDNPAIGYLDLDSKKNNTINYETISGRKTYQVVMANSWDELLENYTFLTGKQPLPAKWTFGNFSSRFGYRSQESVEGTIRKFEENKLPVDAIILDLYWFGKTIKGTMGNLDWDKDNFPEPTKMVSDLNKKNVKTVLISEPFVLTTSKRWNEAVKEDVLVKNEQGKPATWDFYFGNTSVIDIFKPEGKNWFWNIYKKQINQGVGGIWGDLGEPEVFPAFVKTAGGTADEIHNIYGHHWAKLVYDGYAKDFPTQRPFILMRSGYSGTQRYGIIPWSGDVNRSWKGLESQVEISLQMGMQGLAYMHSDLGGFAGDYNDNELYLRWLQYGVFNPIFRPHAQEEVASEIAKKDIVTIEKARKAVDLRYQLLPYNYTLAYENSVSGKPLMRPLFFDEPNNEKLLNEKESYLWGNDFLVKAITKSDVKSTEMYFPKSANWFDFYTNKKYDAGTTQSVNVSESAIPTFIRGGSFIAMSKPILNISEFNFNEIDVHFYYDDTVKTSSGKLFNDDENSAQSIAENKYELVHFSSENNAEKVKIKVQNWVGKNFKADKKSMNFIVHNLQAKKVTVKGKSIPFTKQNNQTQFNINLEKGETLEFTIEK
jgi:oligosaccharide 4-alpha-D-glucosyltransferase